MQPYIKVSYVTRLWIVHIRVLLRKNFNRFYHLEQFQVYSKIKQKNQRFSHPTCPHTCLSPPLSTPHQSGSLMILCQHIIIIKSPQMTLEFTLGNVHSMDMDKCIMTCTQYGSIIWTGFDVIKIPLLCLFIPPSSSTPGDH